MNIELFDFAPEGRKVSRSSISKGNCSASKSVVPRKSRGIAFLQKADGLSFVPARCKAAGYPIHTESIDEIG